MPVWRDAPLWGQGRQVLALLPASELVHQVSVQGRLVWVLPPASELERLVWVLPPASELEHLVRALHPETKAGP